MSAPDQWPRTKYETCARRQKGIHAARWPRPYGQTARFPSLDYPWSRNSRSGRRNSDNADLQTEPVVEHLERLGQRLLIEGNQIAASRGLADYFKFFGHPQCLLYQTLDQNRQPSQGMRSLFLQETIKRGIFMPSLVVGYSHSDAHVDQTLEAIDSALQVYARALDDGYASYLVGRPSQVVYRSHNVSY